MSTVIVDYREPQEVAAYLSLALAGEASVEIDTLPAGDIWWPAESGTYGFELKSTSDMLSSLWSKKNGERLEWQLENLRGFVDVPALAHHGTLVGIGETITITKEPQAGYGKYGKSFNAAIIKDTGYRKDSVSAFLWSIQHPIDGKAIALVERQTKDDLLGAIVTIYHWSQKIKHKTFNHVISRQEAGISQDMAMLLAIGIGEAKAEVLLEWYGGKALHAIQAPEDELYCLKGIGPSTVKRLKALC